MKAVFSHAVVGAILVGISQAPLAALAAVDGFPAPGLYNNADASNIEASPLVKILDNATQTIDIEIYTMGDLAVRASLRKALARGVVIRIVKEPHPVEDSCNLFPTVAPAQDDGLTESSVDATPPASSDNNSPDCQDQKHLVDEVNQAGGSYVAFNKPELCGAQGKYCYQHGKVAVADKKIALISTGNFDATNLCDENEKPSRCNRDYSYVTNDSTLVGTLNDIIDHDVLGRRYDLQALLDSHHNTRLTVSPLSMEPLSAFLGSPDVKTIHLENQYLKDPTLNQILINQAQAGKKVYVTVASPCSFGPPSSSEAKSFTDIFQAFENAGISSSMYNSSQLINQHPAYMHAKVILIDNAHAWVGSVNGSTTSITVNREFGIFVDTPGDIKMLREVIAEDFDSPAAESWQDGLACKNEHGGTPLVPRPIKARKPKTAKLKTA